MEKFSIPSASGERAARRVARNSFFLVASRAFDIATTLVITALTARYLGVDQFGYLAIATAIGMALVPLADFGTERIICREIAKNTGEASHFVSTTLGLRVGISVAILAASSLLLRLLSTWPAQVDAAILLAIAAELLRSTSATYLSVINAFEQMQYELYINMAYKLVMLLLVAAVVLFDWGFLGFFYSRFASSVLLFVLSAALLYGKFVPIAFRFDLRLAGFVLRESYPLAIASIALTLIFRVDVFLLQWLGTPADVSLFEVPNRLIMQLQLLPVAFSLSLFPVFSRIAADGENGPLSGYYAKASRFLLAVSLPISVLLFVGSRPLIAVLFGREFEQASVSLAILAPTTVCLFLVSLQNLFLTAVGRQSLNTLSTLATLALNVALGILLIPRYGYVGASVGTFVAYTAMMAMNSLFVRACGVRTGSGPLVGKIAFAAVLMSLTLFLETRHDLLTMAVRFSAAGAIYIVSMILLKAFTKEDIATLREALSKRRGPPVPDPVPR